MTRRKAAKTRKPRTAKKPKKVINPAPSDDWDELPPKSDPPTPMMKPEPVEKSPVKTDVVPVKRTESTCTALITENKYLLSGQEWANAALAEAFILGACAIEHTPEGCVRKGYVLPRDEQQAKDDLRATYKDQTDRIIESIISGEFLS